MQTIEDAYKEVCRLHEQITNMPAPEIGPQMFMPFPPAVNPVAFAIEEVAHLKNFFESTQAARSQAQQQQQQVAWIPRACIFASDSVVQYQLDIAGVAKKDLSVTVASGEMVVRGVRKAHAMDNALKPVLVEQAWGEFERRFPVPPWCNPEKIHAKCVHGVLEINLQRQEDGTPGEFQVEIS